LEVYGLVVNLAPKRAPINDKENRPLLLNCAIEAGCSGRYRNPVRKIPAETGFIDDVPAAERSVGDGDYCSRLGKRRQLASGGLSSDQP